MSAVAESQGFLFWPIRIANSSLLLGSFQNLASDELINVDKVAWFCDRIIMIAVRKFAPDKIL